MKQCEGREEEGRGQESRVVFVVGSTGSGKSRLALDLAAQLRREAGLECEIVGCDSQQVYVSLGIATNKVTPEELAEFPHHLVGFVSDDDEYSVGRYVQDALRVIQDIHERGKVALVVGGTMLYMEALLFKGLFGNSNFEEEEKAEGEEDKEESVVVHDDDEGKEKEQRGTDVDDENNKVAGKQERQVSSDRREKKEEEEEEEEEEEGEVEVGEEGEEEKKEQQEKKEQERGKTSGSESDLLMEEKVRANKGNTSERASESAAESKDGGRSRTKLSPSNAARLASTALESLSASEAFALLESLDADRAAHLHPNDRKRVLSALNVMKATGRTVSGGQRERGMNGPSSTNNGGSSLRFPSCIVIWSSVESQVLKGLLDSRVDAMVQRGLLEELFSFLSVHTAALESHSHAYTYHFSCDGEQRLTQSSPHFSSLATAAHVSAHAAPPSPPSYLSPLPGSGDDGFALGSGGGDTGESRGPELRLPRGIGQAIGVKEFAPLFSLFRSSAASVLSIHDFIEENSEAKTTYAACLDTHKRATRVYARQQTRYISNRLRSLLPPSRLVVADTTPPFDDDNHDGFLGKRRALLERLAAEVVHLVPFREGQSSPKGRSEGEGHCFISMRGSSEGSNTLNPSSPDTSSSSSGSTSTSGGRSGVEATGLKPRSGVQPRGDPHIKHACEPCGRVIMGTLAWSEHQRSKTHKAAVRKAKGGGGRARGTVAAARGMQGHLSETVVNQGGDGVSDELTHGLGEDILELHRVVSAGGEQDDLGLLFEL